MRDICTTGIVDSHAHYEAEQFDEDRELLLRQVFPASGVACVVNMGSDVATSRATVDLTMQYDYVYGAVGIHPEAAGNLDRDWLSAIETMSHEEKIVAIGEIGLDYHYQDACPKPRQMDVFQAQIDLALRRDLPIVVHDREAHADVMQVLTQYRPRGVLHCFSGSAQMAKQVLQLGFYIGMGGVVTFKNARVTGEVVAVVPKDRLLLETDAPYLSPEPTRGKRNDATKIQYVAEKIAGIWQCSPEEVIAVTNENARRLFRIPPLP